LQELHHKTSVDNRIAAFEGNPERHIGEIFDVNITGWANFPLFGDLVS